jgi:predicted nucleotidyltransferase
MVRKKEIKKIAKNYNLSLILAFGSRISGKSRRDSDLDIAVMAERGLSSERFFKLISDLSKIFPGTEIDLILLNHANPLLLKKIVENCEILYGSRRLLSELKIYAFKKYCDYQPYFRLERQFAHNFIKNFNK